MYFDGIIFEICICKNEFLSHTAWMLETKRCGRYSLTPVVLSRKSSIFVDLSMDITSAITVSF